VIVAFGDHRARRERARRQRRSHAREGWGSRAFVVLLHSWRASRTWWYYIRGVLGVPFVACVEDVVVLLHSWRPQCSIRGVLEDAPLMTEEASARRARRAGHYRCAKFPVKNASKTSW